MQLEYKNEITDVHVIHTIDEETLNETCTLTVKSKLFFRVGNNEMEKEVSNTVSIDNEEIVKLFREERNESVLRRFIKTAYK